MVLESGEEIHADVVSSSVDPNLTFLKFIEARELPGDFLEDVRRYKYRGSSGKVNLALDGLPDFTCLPGPGNHLRGAISISPSMEYMERAYDQAKYGEFSRRPYIDMVIPSLTDPSVAPPGKHILSCFVQYAPYKLSQGNWDEQREAFGNTVIDTISQYAPNLKNLIIGKQVITPLDIERQTGLSEGNIFQGELSLEQLFFLRPGCRLGAVSHADQETLHVRLGHASGRRHHGRTRTARGAGNSERHGEKLKVAAHRSVVILGGGHNALVAAFYLAKKGHKPLVLERRNIVGGAAVTEEFHPGFKCSTVAHAGGPPLGNIVQDMQLARHGLQKLESPVRVFAPDRDGRALTLYSDAKSSAEDSSQVFGERRGAVRRISGKPGARGRNRRAIAGAYPAGYREAFQGRPLEAAENRA